MGWSLKNFNMHKNSFIISLSAILIVYCLGAFAIPLMDVDAAQYASISREMLEKQSYLQLFDLKKRLSIYINNFSIDKKSFRILSKK